MATILTPRTSPGVITTHGETMMVLGWCLLFASTVIVALRIFASVTRRKAVTLSDHLMLAAWSTELLHMIFISIAFSYGLGKHFLKLNAYNQSHALFYSVAFVELWAVTSCMFGRLSFAVFLLRLLGPSDHVKKWTLWAVIVVQIIINAIVVIQIYSQCGSHFSALWDPEVMKIAHCQSPDVETYIGYVQSGLNSICDITLSAIPALILWKLHMPKRQKFLLASVLMLSIFAFAASIVKAIQIKNLSQTGDFTWYLANLQIWVIVENNIVIMAASTPLLKPLLSRRSQSSSAYMGGSGPFGVDDSQNSTGRNDRRWSKKGTHDTITETNSDEHILPHRFSRATNPGWRQSADSQIIKTTDVNVSISYDEENPQPIAQPEEFERFNFRHSNI